MKWILLPSGKFVDLSKVICLDPKFKSDGTSIHKVALLTTGGGIVFGDDDAEKLWEAMQDFAARKFTPQPR